MKKLSVVVLLLICSFAMAQVADDALVGQWEFDNPESLTSATVGSDLVLVGTESAVDGPSVTNGAVNIGTGSFYHLVNTIDTAASAGSYVNEFSFLFDVKVNELGQWYTLWQSNTSNANDGEIFIDPIGKLGVQATSYTDPIIEPNFWNRIVVTVSNEDSIFNYYVNGVLVNEADPQDVDGRFSIGEFSILFGDNDGDDGPINVAEVRLYDRVLEESEVSELGGFAHLEDDALVGQWEFDNPESLTSATVGPDLVLFGTESAVVGPSATNGAVNIGTGSLYHLVNTIDTAASAGSYVNEFSFLFDIKVNELGQWYTLWQSDISNASDGEIFINPSGSIGVGATGYTDPIIEPNFWNRIVVTVSNENSIFNYYVNGVLVYEADPQDVDGRFSIGEFSILFGDNDGDDGPINVAEVRLYDRVLEESEVSELGGFAQWVLADWEAGTADTYFDAGGWGSEGNGIMTLERRDDPTGTSDGVLFSSWNFVASVENPKDALTKTPIDLGWTATEDGATSITLDIYVPADFPAGIEIGFWMQSHDWGWFSTAYSVSDSSTIKPEEWCTITLDLAANAETLKLREGNPQLYGIQLFSSVDWTGDILFDNLTVHGLEAPDEELHTPTIVTSFNDTVFAQSGKENLYVTIEWDDSDQPGTEVFEVYMSESPISDLTDDGVLKIGSDIPHDVGYWNHRPYTATGEAKTYYYAVIARIGEEVTEITAEGSAGPIEFTRTNLPAVAKYDPDFSSKFTLDGLDTEFTEEYKVNAITPEEAANVESDNWTLESTDLMFHNTFVADDEYLYISADVTDNSVLTEQGISQAWQGDALEFFFGAYDIAEQTAWHTRGDVGTAGTGDHRWAFTAWGTIELNGYQAVENYAGVEFIVYQKWGGDGYIIEAKINLDSLAADGNFDVVEGMMCPMKIDANDRDPVNNDDGRTLAVLYGGITNHENWQRPSSWGMLLIGEPAVAIDDEEEVAMKFELQDNYPNPFNPTTNIRFQIPAVGNVQLTVYDMLGNKIKTIVNETRSAGAYDVQWDGTNDMGVNVATGLYFYKLTSENHVATKKMMFIK